MSKGARPCEAALALAAGAVYTRDEGATLSVKPMTEAAAGGSVSGAASSGAAVGGAAGLGAAGEVGGKQQNSALHTGVSGGSSARENSSEGTGLPATWAARWALPQDPNTCTALESNATAPLGPPEPERNPLCGALVQPGVRTVAVVGNGPLDEAARMGIAAADVVVRFNLMNNWRRFEERVDVWVIRFSTEASLRYWGLTNLRPEDTARVVGGAQAVWLLGGEQEDADTLVQRVPSLQGPPRKAVRIPLGPLAAAYAAWLRIRDGSPSTGFVGIAAVLHCAPPAAVVHLYGMNWHEKTWRGHKMADERAHWAPAVATGRVVVHGTPCHGMRECGQGDLDQSCHWEGGKYLCIFGSPRRWTDFTGLLEEGRAAEYLRPPPAADVVQ
ncbi:hypothetical protein WJX81_001900 [Elliptochloris bilobata]|uniref:Uncharacterized protein n=1 Tax=Elliptochloris bilobata TaxID=381761 RepID=A0AAW1SDQ5_9CHLO